MESLKLDVNIIADLIASKFIQAGESISVLKLHKLVYYVEAWHLVFTDKMIFDDNFEAWVHGPVCREVFKKFRYGKNKFTYSDVGAEDIDVTKFEGIPESINLHIESVLESYGKFSGVQLESLTHQESPWIDARGGLPASTPSEAVITKESMKNFYSQYVG